MERDFSDVWAEIQERARYHMDRGLVVYTLATNVPNRITKVTDAAVERMSTQSQSGRPSPVSRKHVERLWKALVVTGEVSREDTPYFAYALLQRFIPGIGFDSNPLRLYFTNREVAVRPYSNRAGHFEASGIQVGSRGEGEIHRALKDAIARDPLGTLGEALNLIQVGYVFASGDRVDLLFQDDRGSFVCVEVEPDVHENDMVPYLQAAKYRALTALTYDVPVESVRTIVAARSFHKVGVRRWAIPYGIGVTKVFRDVSETPESV